jgi:hypothetical protein
MSSSNPNQEAWDFAKNSLRLEDLKVSSWMEAEAQKVINGESTWDQLIANLKARHGRSFAESATHVR